MIEYRRLEKKDLDEFIRLRINQLREEGATEEKKDFKKKKASKKSEAAAATTLEKTTLGDIEQLAALKNQLGK